MSSGKGLCFTAWATLPLQLPRECRLGVKGWPARLWGTVGGRDRDSRSKVYVTEQSPRKKLVVQVTQKAGLSAA